MSDETEPAFVLRPRPVSPTDLRWSERADALEFETLDRLRRTAERWTASLGAILGLSSSIFILKGRDDITQLSSSSQALVGVLLLLALIVGVTATYLAARAAQGAPRKVAWPNGKKLRAWEHSESLLVQRLLRISRALALVAVALVAGAVAVTWFGSGKRAQPAGATLLVLRNHGAPLCGTLTGQTALSLRFARTDGPPVTLQTAYVEAVVPVDRCPRAEAAR